MIQSDSVLLRAIEPNDLESLRGWRNRPSLRRYFREHRELTSADQQAWYARITARDSDTLMFAIADSSREDTPLVGAAGLCYIDWVRRSAEVSLYVGLDDLYIDERIAPQALGALVDHGFGELGLHRLWTEVYSFDERKARLYEEFGFRLEGRHRESHFADGEWHDSLYFGLLSGERTG